MERVLRGTSSTIQVTFQVDGVATDAGDVTVTITRDDGTVLVLDTPTAADTTGVYQYTLTAADTATLDILTAVWSGEITSEPQTLTTTTEIVGGFLFTIAEARAVSPLGDTTKYPTADLIAIRTLVEEALEDACGVAFVPRYGRETISGRGTDITLVKPRVTSVRSVSVDGTAISAGDLTGIKTSAAGEVYYSTRWVTGFSNHDITYEHGYTRTPAAAKQAALVLAKNWLIKGPIDDRTTAFSTEDGTYSLATPGVRGSLFGIPIVDAFVESYGLNAGIV